MNAPHSDLTVWASDRQEPIQKILDIVSCLSGFSWVCVARVTAQQWTACAIKDGLRFGLKIGDQIPLDTTFCKDVRNSKEALFISSVQNSEKFREHPTPKLYQFENYFSVPILLADGTFFGTLCGIDRKPVIQIDQRLIEVLHHFSELVALELMKDDDLQIERSETDFRAQVATQELAYANNALIDEQAAAELREKFVAVLGHDLRNPLNNILLSASAVEKSDLDIRDRALVTRIRKSALRMSGLINDILDFARGRLGGGITVSIIPQLNFSRQLEEVIAELQIAHPLNPILRAIPSNLEVVCDGPRICQLLSNLLKNALIHGEREQPVTVRAVVAEGAFLLEVENFGSPIPPEMQKNIFSAFSQADSKTAKEGLGLGLFIVNEIAKSHGGSIFVKSDIENTVFSLRLPQ